MSQIEQVPRTRRSLVSDEGEGNLSEKCMGNNDERT